MNNSNKSSNFKKYGLRRRKPLETIQESDVNGLINKSLSAPEDEFDKLFNSPMKQHVTLKPLSHWGKKLAELDKPTSHSKKMKDLYEMSSPDESSPYRKMKKKPKPRKKKENLNLFDGLIAKSYKSIKPKQGDLKPREIKKAVNLREIPLLIVDQKPKTKNWLTSSRRFPIFGLTSTPDKTKTSYLTEPSFYNFCSPIVTEKNRPISGTIDHTPKNTKLINKINRFSTNQTRNSVGSIDVSVLSNQISENELMANAFSGFSSFHEDPETYNLRGESTVILHNNDCQIDNVLLQGPSPKKGELTGNAKDQSMTYKDNNVTLRRKCKRSERQLTSPDLTTTCVLPTDTNEFITIRRPKRISCKNKELSKELNHEKNVPKNNIKFYEAQSKTSPQQSELPYREMGTAYLDEINKEEIATDVTSQIIAPKPKRSRKIDNEFKVVGGIKVRNNGLNSEISPYFPTEVKSSSDSSFIMDSPPKQNTRLKTEHMDKLEIEKICDSNLNKTLACLNSTLVLKGGKQHNRARVVLRQLQTGRLNLNNTTLLPHVPVGRGRGYETFVGELLEMQPGLEETLQNVACVSPNLQLAAMKRTRSTINKPKNSVQSRRNTSAYKRKSQDLLQASRVLDKGNRTVHFVEDNTPLPAAGWRCSIRGQRRVSRIEKPLNAPNLSVRVIPSEQHEATIFRTAFGIDELSTAKVGDNSADKLFPWTAKDAILSRCNQTDPLHFSEHFNELTLPDCKKIGEGVYGEVFMYSSKSGPSVFKVIPIEGDLLVNDEPQKTFTEILSEIVISMELSNLRHGKEQQSSGYAELRRTWCLQGEYPDFLVDLWNDYDLRKGSENDNPTMFPDEQLYIVLELAHGGLDLEAFVFRNAAQSLSAFRQAAFSLAVAERALEFEHRDFHWGNVLVSETSEKFITFTLDDHQFQIPSEGVKVTIIDFTLSRITFEGCSVFNDLSVDPGLFTSEGDYQFEIYRMMRDETKNNWEQFTPKTNVYWLHYTLDKMLSLVRYSRPKSKPHSTAVRKLRKFKECALEFSDSAKFVLSTF